MLPWHIFFDAEVVELVDALDSKSSGGNPVTVRLRPSALLRGGRICSRSSPEGQLGGDASRPPVPLYLAACECDEGLPRISSPRCGVHDEQRFLVWVRTSPFLALSRFYLPSNPLKVRRGSEDSGGLKSVENSVTDDRYDRGSGIPLCRR